MASSCLVYNQCLKCESIHTKTHTLVEAKKLDVLKISFFSPKYWKYAIIIVAKTNNTCMKRMLLYGSCKSSLLSVWCNTGCNRRNVRDFGRVLLRSNYTDITQNTYIKISIVTEILAREKSGILWCLRTVLCL